MRLVVCSRDELASVILEQPALLLSLADPLGEPELPMHAVGNLLDSLVLQFADIAPEEVQERWTEPIVPYDRPAAELVMNADHGKKLWAFLLRKRDRQPEVIVIQDGGDRRALSVALAVCKVLSLPIPAAVYRVGEPEWKGTEDEKPPNRHVFDMTKASRARVV